MPENVASAVSRIAPKIPGDLVRGNTVSAVGDSITANGGAWPLQLARSWLQWACALSGGRARAARPHASGGYTTAQILAEHVPAVIADSPRPAACVVLGGTNDTPNTGGGLTAVANLTTMYRMLRAAGIVPILATIPPRSESGGIYNANRDIINTFVCRYAAANGLPLVDFHAALTGDDGFYLSGYDADGVHPSEQGAEAMGAALGSVLAELLPPGKSPLAVDNTGASLRVGNPLFLTDTNSDGVPDNWAKTGAGGESTVSLVDATTDAAGNWLTIDKTGGTAASGARVSNISVTAGNVLRWDVVARVSNLAAGASVVVAVANSASPNTIYAGPLYTWSRAIGPAVLSVEVTVPAGVTAILLDAYVTGGTGRLELAQSTLRNLTTLGIT